MWIVVAAIAVTPLLWLATVAPPTAAPADPLPPAVTPGSLATLIDAEDFRGADGGPGERSQIDAIASSARGVTYLAVSDETNNGHGQLWFTRGDPDGVRRLDLDQDPGEITSLIPIDLPPSSSSYSDETALARAEAREGLMISGSRGVFLAEVQLPRGSGATGRVELAQLRPEDGTALVGVSDMAEGAQGSLYLTGFGGPDALSEIVARVSGGMSTYDELLGNVLAEDGAVDMEGALPPTVQSGETGAVRDIVEVAASHAGDLVVLDRGGRRIVRVTDGVPDVLYTVPEDHGEIRDVVFDEIGNLYWTSREGVHRLDVTGQVEILVPSDKGSTDMVSGYRIADPAVTAITAEGALLVAAAGELEVTAVRSVANLDSAATDQLQLNAWVQGRPLQLSVVQYCACQDVVTENAFFKVKVSLESSGVSEQVALDPRHFYLLGLVEGAPSLNYEIPAPATGQEEQIDEQWSGRTLLVSQGSVNQVLDALDTFDVTGTTYGLYALPASPLDVAVRSPDGLSLGFASELTGGSVAPGSSYYDERAGYGSLVFAAPRQSAAGAPVRVVPVALGYWDGSAWRGFAEIGSWGAPGIPWDF